LVDSWQRRLGVFLEDHPEAAARLEALVARDRPGSSTTINAQSHDRSTMIIAPGGTVNMDRKRR
jgi:hypothetical protein